MRDEHTLEKVKRVPLYYQLYLSKKFMLETINAIDDVLAGKRWTNSITDSYS